MHVAVIGSGLLGVTTAYFLRRHGLEVTVVDRQEGPALETSFANAGYIQSSIPSPWNSPGVGKLLLQSWLAGLSRGSEKAPLLLRTRAIPRFMRWGLGFLANAKRESYLSATLKNLRLAAYTRQVMAALREEETLEYSESFAGAIILFRSRESLADYNALAEHFGERGAVSRYLGRDELVALEPALRPVADRLLGGTHHPDDEAGDARVFCAQLARIAQHKGVKFEYDTTVMELRAGRHGFELLSDRGDLSADAVVVAAGSYSGTLAGPLGVKLPVAPVKGYSISVPMAGWEGRPRHVVGDMVLNAGITPLGDVLRVAGTAEFTGYDLHITEGRVRNLVSLLEQVFPDFAATIDPSTINPWAGLRPMTTDGVPVVSATPVPNLFLNTGHGALGWTHAAGSAKALADVIAGVEPAIDMGDYSILRFEKNRSRAA